MVLGIFVRYIDFSYSFHNNICEIIDMLICFIMVTILLSIGPVTCCNPQICTKNFFEVRIYLVRSPRSQYQEEKSHMKFNDKVSK
jgi:hypothetical protein